MYAYLQKRGAVIIKTVSGEIRVQAVILSLASSSLFTFPMITKFQVFHLSPYAALAFNVLCRLTTLTWLSPVE
jgi:hypothetical protein